MRYGLHIIIGRWDARVALGTPAFHHLFLETRAYRANRWTFTSACKCYSCSSLIACMILEEIAMRKQ